MKPGDRVWFHYVTNDSVDGKRALAKVEAVVVEDQGDNLLSLDVLWPEEQLKFVGPEEIACHKDLDYCVRQTTIPKAPKLGPLSHACSWSRL